jgi:hypothetical protein
MDQINLRGAAYEIINPFGLAMVDGVNLNRLCREDPAEFETANLKYSELTLTQARMASTVGATTVIYRLHGAHPRWSTPMEYGGLHLETDRELLREISNLIGFPVAFIVGDEGVYLDCVTDLPALVFGWDIESTGVSVAEIKLNWSGEILAASPEAEFELQPNVGGRTIAEFLEEGWGDV